MDDSIKRKMCYGTFKQATTEHSISVLKKGLKSMEKLGEIMTDHGTQFVALKTNMQNINLENIWKRVKHLLARVQHPQTNGKVERFFRLVEWNFCSRI